MDFEDEVHTLAIIGPSGSVIRELKEEGMRFIIVTHEMGFARHACDKAAFLCEGSLREYGKSVQLFAHPESNQLKRFWGKLLA